MNQENWNQAKEIFYAALDKSPDEREKFLAKACGDDLELLADVRILLKSYRSEFLEEPILGSQSQAETRQFAPESQFQPGQKINHYTISGTLGRGGMGEVYLAQDEKLDRPVAVKVLHKGAGKQAEKRLLREARSAAKLAHPNICSIYEVSETKDFPFIVMQYVEGETLDILIRKNSLSAKQSIEFVRQIADALEEAHTHNIVHRDIKPSNIIIDLKKQVKVLDFSLAKKAVLEADGLSESVLSEFGMVIGTIAYMSPEQARGQDIDTSTDIWSLGVVFYEMLTGQAPFSGDSKSDIIASILTKDPPRLSANLVNISPEFDQIIGKALQKDRALRYGSIKDFSADLEVLAEGVEDFKKINSPDAVDKTTAIISAGLISKDSLQQPTDEVGQTTYETEKKFPVIPLPSPKTNRQWLIPAFVALTVIFGGVYWKFYANSSAKSAPFSAESRNNWQVSTLLSQKRNPVGDISEFRFSPDGKLFSFLIDGEGTKDIYIKQADQGEPKKLTDGKSKNFTPVWSPDGQKIAFVSNRENKAGIWSIPYLGGTPVLLNPIDINLISFRLKKWSNDGKRIFFETDNKLKTIELGNGKIEEIKLPEKENTGHFAISKDERLIVFTVEEGENRNIWVQTLGSDDAKQLTTDKGKKYYPYFFPDNHRIAYSSDTQGSAWQIFLIDINDLQPIQLTLGDSNGRSPIVSPDGSKIIFYSHSDECNIFSIDLKTKKEAAETTNAHLQLFPQLSPQDDKIVFQTTESKATMLNSSLKIKSLGKDSAILQLSQSGSFPKWSPDGDFVFFVSYRENKVNIWKQNPLDLKEIQLTKKGVETEGFQFSPFNLMDTPFSFSKTQNKIFYISEQSSFSNIWSLDENGSNEQMLTKNEDKNLRYFSPTPSNDDSKIAFTFRNKFEANNLKYGLAVLDNDSVQNLYETDSLIRILGWTQSGNELLAAVKKENEVEIFKFSLTPNSFPVSLVKLKGAYVHGFALSPDATKIAFTARRDKIDNVYLYPLDGKESQLTSNQDETIQYSALSWSTKGERLFYGKQFGSMQISVISDNK